MCEYSNSRRKQYANVWNSRAMRESWQVCIHAQWTLPIICSCNVILCTCRWMCQWKDWESFWWVRKWILITLNGPKNQLLVGVLVMFRVTLHMLWWKNICQYIIILKYLLLDCMLGSWNDHGDSVIVFLHYPLHYIYTIRQWNTAIWLVCCRWFISLIHLWNMKVPPTFLLIHL